MNIRFKFYFKKIIILIGVILIVWDQLSVPNNFEVIKQNIVKNFPDRLLPSKDFATDGCTLWPDSFLEYNWEKICVEHDVVYWMGGMEEARLEADTKLRKEANKILPYSGDLIYYSVRIFGNKYIPSHWRWGYGWSYPYNHEEYLKWVDFKKSGL